MTENEGSLGKADMSDRPGMPTYRQLFNWTHQGLLRTQPRKTTGPGSPQRWLPGEDIVAATILRLQNLGFSLELAARVARDGKTGNGYALRLEEGEVSHWGVWVLVDIRPGVLDATHD